LEAAKAKEALRCGFDETIALAIEEPKILRALWEQTCDLSGHVF
jgi:hypothetical protein